MFILGIWVGSLSKLGFGEGVGASPALLLVSEAERVPTCTSNSMNDTPAFAASWNDRTVFSL